MASSSRSASETISAATADFASPCCATALEEALLEAKKNEAPREASFSFFAWCFLEEDEDAAEEVSSEEDEEAASGSAPNVSATARQHRLRCAAAAPAESPMMSSQPHRCSFHICTSSPGERDCRNVSGSTIRGWYDAMAGAFAFVERSRLSPAEALREETLVDDDDASFFPSSETETASATVSSAARAAASPPASFVKSPLTNAVTSGKSS